MRRYFLLGDPTELYSMSDSETSTAAGMSHASTPARPTPWSRKHAKIEKAARMRSKTKRPAVPSGDPAVSTTTPRDDRMSSDQEESDARDSTARPLPVHSQTPTPVSSDRGRSDARGSSARPLPVNSQTPAPVSSDQEESDARGPTARPHLRFISHHLFSSFFYLHQSSRRPISTMVAQAETERELKKCAVIRRPWEHQQMLNLNKTTHPATRNSPLKRSSTTGWSPFDATNVEYCMVVILMEHFKNRLNLNVKAAATEAGSIVWFNEKTIRQYRNDFFENEGHFTAQLQGKYERQCVHNSEELNHKAAEWGA